jgi:2'-5' RNA ligase
MPRRLFIAADISEDARAVVSDLLSRLRTGQSSKGVSWVKPENLHITIKFLGDADEATETELIETLEWITSTYAPFTLQLVKPELLGKRVMSIAVRSDTSTVFSLEMVIDTECERLGFKREGRRFHPHVTLARIRDPRAARDLVSQFSRLQLESVEFDVREIILYESRMTPAGSEYSKIKAFTLQT